MRAYTCRRLFLPHFPAFAGEEACDAKRVKMRSSCLCRLKGGRRDDARVEEGIGGATSGLSSSLAFTPIQGIELVNPNVNKNATSGTDSVFSEMRGFRKVSAGTLQRQLKD